ncbi:MAG: beta-ketoacyl synthase N-terminal-like domain-containing protein, partial [Cyanobacteria bacterium P01_H01_bin.121]
SPIRGVIHTAGTGGGLHPIATLDAEILAQTLEPKVNGTWNLHQLSLNWELDFFVCFSSIASVWGSAQQAHYAAANAFQDVFAACRRSQGLPALTINWSAIADSGMLREAEPEMLQRLRQVGIKPLSLDRMQAALQLLLANNAEHAVVADLDWSRFDAIYQTGRPRTLLQELVTAPPESATSSPIATQSNWYQQFEALPVSERSPFLRQTLQQETAQILGLAAGQLPDPQVGFFELGMDSLMAVQLQSRLAKLLGFQLPSTLAFDFPNLATLERFLLDEYLAKPEVSQADIRQPSATTPALQEPIAIIGMGCRFPGGADTPDKFWELLRSGESPRQEVPQQRWDLDTYYDASPDAPGKMLTRYGHFVEAVDQFEPGFFRIPPREAIAIDPQHRLLLEVGWEALERSGQALERLAGAEVGVFIGQDGHDYEQLLQEHLQQEPDSPLATYVGTGSHISSAAGRLAYTLGLTGPTMTLDTACSSSLVAIHQACNSLRLGECQLALAGGVKLHLVPASYVAASRARMLSPDGLCKTFDSSADGYGRGEGCGLVVLKPLSMAERDGDPTLALIRGSAVNQDGPSSGLTVPNGRSQQRLIEQALTRAQVQPSEISYLEAHGTGTPLGDPIEVNAAANVLGRDRDLQQPLWVGSVKTNIGHLEAAAGISGVIKVVLALQQRQIPAHLHLQEPNPKIDWQPWLHVPKTLMPWDVNGSRLAGVSSFGFTGTNAHIVLEEAPVSANQHVTDESDCPFQVLQLSAQSPEALAELATRYHQHLSQHPEQDLADVCFTATTGRLVFEQRLCAIAETKAELVARLAAFSSGQESFGLVTGTVTQYESPQVAFLFTGQGSQYIGMGRQLYATQPIFREALDRCAEILATQLNRPLLNILYPEASQESPINQTAYTQPALFAIEYALYQLWRSWGIEPSVVMGHSIGEYVAACVAGVFSLEDGLKLIAMRGKLMQQLPAGGVMVSFLATEQQVREALSPTPLPGESSEVSIAAINGPQSIVISGAAATVQAVVDRLEAAGVKHKALQVSHAFHSPLMQPMLAEFEQVARQIRYAEPQLKFISNVTGQVATAEVATPEYWCQHVLAPVNFAAGMATLHQQNYEVLLECGPKPILLGMGRLCVPLDYGVWLPSLRSPDTDWQTLLTSLSELSVRGVEVNWQDVPKADPNRHKVLLPTYPFQRERYWVETKQQPPILPVQSQLATGELQGQRLEIALTGQTVYSQVMSLKNQPWIGDHRVYA